jgi:hypothetical protein
MAPTTCRRYGVHMNGDTYLALCICVGVLFGLAIHNIIIGVGFGVAMKVARDRAA